MVVTELGGEFLTLANVGCGRAVRFAIQALNLRLKEFFGDGLHFVFSFWFSCAELRLFPAGGRPLPGRWRDSVLVGSDGAGGFRLRAVGEEADDHGALFLAKPARSTRSSRAGTLSRANDHAISGGRGHGERRVGGEDDDDRTAVGGLQFIRLRQIIGAEIHGESTLICGAHCGAVAGCFVVVADNGLVRVSPPALSSVRVYQLGEHIGVDCVISTGKITRLIMPPQLPKGERRNPAHKRRPIITAPLFRHFPPVERQRTARRCVTPLRFERACVWAGGRGGSGHGQRSRFYVSAFHRKVKAGWVGGLFFCCLHKLFVGECGGHRLARVEHETRLPVARGHRLARLNEHLLSVDEALPAPHVLKRSFGGERAVIFSRSRRSGGRGGCLIHFHGLKFPRLFSPVKEYFVAG